MPNDLKIANKFLLSFSFALAISKLLLFVDLYSTLSKLYESCMPLTLRYMNFLSQLFSVLINPAYRNIFIIYSIVFLAIYSIVKFRKEDSLNWTKMIVLSFIYGSSMLFVQACRDEFFILLTGKFELLKSLKLINYDLIRILIFVLSIVSYFLLQTFYNRTIKSKIDLSYFAIFSFLLVSSAEFQLVFHSIVGLKNNIFIVLLGSCLTLLISCFFITKFVKIENSERYKVIEIVPFFVGVYLFYAGFRYMLYVATNLLFSTYQINVRLFMMRGLFNCAIGIILILIFRAISKKKSIISG